MSHKTIGIWKDSSIIKPPKTKSNKKKSMSLVAASDPADGTNLLHNRKSVLLRRPTIHQMRRSINDEPGLVTDSSISQSERKGRFKITDP